MKEEFYPKILQMFGIDECWFMMDGAPGHWAREVRVDGGKIR
jgi:hypothetical protein